MTSLHNASPTVTTYYSNNGEVWQYWNRNWVGSASVSQTGTVTPMISNTAVWGSWCSSPLITGATGSSLTVSGFSTNRIVMPAQRAIRKIRRALRPQKDRSKIKAETLLLQNLDRSQRLTWLNANYFDISVGDRRYRIRRGWAGNVDLLDAQGKAIVNYCCHPNTHVPEADCALSQMMMLLYDEAGFLKLANIAWRDASLPYPRRQAA